MEEEVGKNNVCGVEQNQLGALHYVHVCCVCTKNWNFWLVERGAFSRAPLLWQKMDLFGQLEPLGTFMQAHWLWLQLNLHRCPHPAMLSQMNFRAKIHHKHQGVVKIKANLFMEVFEVDDLPLWIVIVLCGWWLSFLIGESALAGVAPPWT